MIISMLVYFELFCRQTSVTHIVDYTEYSSYNYYDIMYFSIKCVWFQQ